MMWCFECDCLAKNCVSPDWHKHFERNVIDDLKKIVSQNKSEQECYKDILTYLYKEKR